jgi:autotransporter-associated beta strand protein
MAAGNSYRTVFTGNISLLLENTLNFDQGGLLVSAASVISGSGSLVIRSSDATTSPVVFEGVNTYSGGTQLAAGMLDVKAAGGLGSGNVALSGASTLRLLSDRALDRSAALWLGNESVVVLAFSGKSIITALSFDGGRTLAASGIWGSVGSGADHTNPRLTGPGRLLVGPNAP